MGYCICTEVWVTSLSIWGGKSYQSSHWKGWPIGPKTNLQMTWLSFTISMLAARSKLFLFQSSDLWVGRKHLVLILPSPSWDKLNPAENSIDVKIKQERNDYRDYVLFNPSFLSFAPPNHCSNSSLHCLSSGLLRPLLTLFPYIHLSFSCHSSDHIWSLFKI